MDRTLYFDVMNSHQLIQSLKNFSKVPYYPTKGAPDKLLSDKNAGAWVSMVSYLENLI